MEFRFPVQDLFIQEITLINNTLIPDDYQGDHETYRDCQEKITTILDNIGQLSGIAQGLQVPVTSTERLKNSDHRVYLMVDLLEGENGQVIGLLKVGNKKLYVFDQSGQHHQLNPLCVLDFYIHESKQRLGCGKKLYEHMLQAEGVEAGHLAFDRPSEKLLSFLTKHYNLTTIIPQSNNFVVFDTFFDSRTDEIPKNNYRKHSELDGEVAYARPAAGCSTVYRDVQAQASRRAAVVNRPHSSISKVFRAENKTSLYNGQGSADISGGDNNDFIEPPHHLVSSAPSITTSCSNELPDTPHRDIKFEHQRLW